MHETSIINSIVRTLEVELSAEKRKKMKAIYLKVGVLSNVEPRLLHSAYSVCHLMHPDYSNVALHIESTDLKTQCEVCNHVTDVKNYRFICENCERPCKKIIQGEELLVHKIEFED